MAGLAWKIQHLYLISIQAENHASTCHAAQLLIPSKIVAGKKISGYYSIKDEINNAGAVYADKPAVLDGNIVTIAHFKDLGIWMKTALVLTSKVS